MLGQIAIQNLLNKAFEEQQQRNARFSQRAFAKKLEISQGSLSEILDGKRSVSYELAEKIISKLKLDPQEQLDVLKYFVKPELRTRDQLTDSEKEIGIEFVTINNEIFKRMSWVHYAILSLVKTKDFTADSQWIADHLGVDQETVQLALALLIENEMLVSYPTGKMERSIKRIKRDQEIF
jgi:uncharacterized protein (TIGR02147 family)